VSNKEKNIVTIKKLKTNFELQYDYLKILNEFIKKLPREHFQVKARSVIDLNGGEKTEWVRIVSEVEMGKVLSFLVDNSIPFVFSNVSPDVIKKLKDEFKQRQQRLSEILKLKASSLDTSNDDYSFLKLQPYDYQKQAIKFFEINNGKAILGDQPGVGKTLPAIGYSVKNNFKSLIICPSSLKLNWKREIETFTNEKAFVFKYKIRNKKNERLSKKEESSFHIINYDLVESYVKFEYKHKCSGTLTTPERKIKRCNWEETDLVKSHKTCPQCKNINTIKSKICGVVFFADKEGEQIFPEHYDLVIVDECHRMKEQKTTWTKLIKKSFDEIPRKILLSGTLIKNRPFELFSILNFLDPKEWNNSHSFGTRYCAAYEDKFGWDYSGASNLEELFERLSPYFLRRLKRDVLKSLPPKTHTNIPIDLTDSEYKEYKTLEKEKILKDDGTEIEQTYLAKIHKLKLFTGKIKLNRAIQMIQDVIDGDEKIVIFSDYIEIAKSIQDFFKDACVLHTGEMNITDKEESVIKFQNDKKIKVFSGMVIASGVGITLTASSKLMFLGFAWSPSDMEQAEDRVHRATTTSDNIQILKLVCKDTIDEDINELLEDKSQIVSKVLDNKNYKKEIHTSDESIFKRLVERMKQENTL